jgi:hypothetical protein
MHEANMARRGRPPVLDERKQREIVAILSVGCSRRCAAYYVRCSPKMIRNTARREPKFAENLKQADSHGEVFWMKCINAAAKKEQYWRAAAWALEHIRPERYAKQPLEVITIEQISQLLAQFARIVVEEIPISKYRKAVLKRFDALRKEIRGKTTPAIEQNHCDHEDETSDTDSR